MARLLAVITLAVLIGCTNIQSFTPIGGAAFEPYPEAHAVDYWLEQDQVEREYTIVGAGETRASTLPEALDILRNMGRKYGADAFYGMDTTGIGYGVSNYRTTFIRYR